MLISILWLAALAWITAMNWSGERVSTHDALWFNNNYHFTWGEEHPECRDRFAFWPDGKEMDARYFEFFYDTGIGARIPLRSDMSPDAARDWVNKVRREVSECEEAQWMPLAKADAIRKERISLVSIALLPPIILLLASVTIIWAWTRFAKLQWLSLPMHQRRGLLRLYFLVAVPWFAWFGYKSIDGIQHNSRYGAHAFWSLISVPIGGPILLLVIVWVISGFRKPLP
jgi:hypothetical protein